jgi:CRISPR system Cascade subunit CasE
MYLTRFEINTARRAARDLLASPQRMHGAVLAAFPSSRATSLDERVLWRVDHHERQAVLYLVSPDRPDLTHLVENVGWPTTEGWATRDYTPLLDRLAVGQRWGFRLAANPVHNRRKTDDSQRSQRLGHITVAQQTEWLLRRAEHHGFILPLGEQKEPDVAVRGRRTVRFARQGHTVTLDTAVFEGRLEVTDPTALRAALARGIGHGKAYGCGLLTLARTGE